ncbi:hypothetical protein B0H10DRAFT_2221284 [Mycena sp. CBHHK59/15]|nr:hypothetical protein B0H10DRAFT_2221284 [Mycena sp. CBHHK59/15]
MTICKVTHITSSWNIELTWELITAIEEDEEIQDGLFPGVGGIPQTGGKPKKHHYYKLACILFLDHPDYKEIFQINPKHTAVQLNAQRKLWTEKVKNKLAPLVAKARENIIEMGETGAEIASEDDILPGMGLTTKWDLIKLESPWFFHLQDLIAVRPNLQPDGLGNNDSGYDLSLLNPSHGGDGSTSSGFDDTQDLPKQLSEPGPLDDTSDSDEDLPPTITKAKRKRKDSDTEFTPNTSKPAAPAPKKTKPQPAVSVPAPPAVPVGPKKTLNAKDRFSDTIVAEEETQQ